MAAIWKLLIIFSFAFSLRPTTALPLPVADGELGWLPVVETIGDGMGNIGNWILSGGQWVWSGATDLTINAVKLVQENSSPTGEPLAVSIDPPTTQPDYFPPPREIVPKPVDKQVEFPLGGQPLQPQPDVPSPKKAQ